jgi:hypothetical protein
MSGHLRRILNPNLTRLPGDISDKSGHSIGYAMLGGLILRALAGGRLRGVTWKRGLLAIVLATLYGVSDEFHQLFVPGTGLGFSISSTTPSFRVPCATSTL